jgi:hypothetical protein
MSSGVKGSSVAVVWCCVRGVRRLAPVLTLTLCLELAVGCTTLEPETDTAASVLGVAGGGNDSSANAVPENWACLASPVIPATRMPERVQYIVGIVDFDSQPAPNTPTAVPGLEITVCGSPSCDPPFGEPEVVITNPVEGLPPYVYSIEFPYNFSNGSLRLTAPNYTPMHYVFGGPLIGPPEGGTVVRGLSIPLLKTATRDTIYNDLGLTGEPDPTRGVLAVRTLDCARNAQGQSQRAAGVALRAVPNQPPAPAVAWTLSFSNRATPNKLETDARGVAGFVNVVPGSLDVEGVTPYGATYGATTLPVRAGVITLAEVRDGLDRWGQ